MNWVTFMYGFLVGGTLVNWLWSIALKIANKEDKEGK